jgi:hypothetical protein
MSLHSVVYSNNSDGSDLPGLNNNNNNNNNKGGVHHWLKRSSTREERKPVTRNDDDDDDDDDNNNNNNIWKHKHLIDYLPKNSRARNMAHNKCYNLQLEV